MYKKYFILIVMCFICTMSLSLFAQTVAGIIPAELLPLNEVKDGSISASDTLDVWQISADATKMYTINTLTDPLKFQAKAVLMMDVLDENGVTILKASPNGRYDQMGVRLTGWVPPKTGIYYVKIWGTPAKLATIADPSYKMRFWYGTPVADAAALHEPDNTAAQANALGDTPTDGTMIRGYLYNHYVSGDSIDTNFNDFDLYKITVPVAGMVLTAETFSSARLWGHPQWCRDLDTEIYLLDETGVATPIKNDDKTSWLGDPWDNDNPLTPGVSNTYSRFVSPPIPSAGTWYVQVNSYYNNLIAGRTSSPKNTHKDPGGGEYVVSLKLVSADNPSLISQPLTLNQLKDGSISVADTLDAWQILAEDTKMYTICTVTDPLKFQAKAILNMDVVDEMGKTVLNSSPTGRNDQMGARLTGWVPPKTGIYYVKIWSTPAKLATVADPSYKMRFWYGTPLVDALALHEPDNTAVQAAALGNTPTDGTMIRGYLYNHYVDGSFSTNFNDFDLYKITVPTAGMVLTAETFTSARLFDHPEWCRDLDTEIYLLDENGVATPINDDDKNSWAGDPWDNDNPLTPGVSNTYSRFVSPPIPSAGTWYVQVISYYNNLLPGRNSSPKASDKDPGGGEYLVAITLTLPAEQEPNNDLASANLITLQNITDAALAPTDSVDYFKFMAEDNKMYTLNTIAPRGVNIKNVLKMKVLDKDGNSVLTSDPSSRYDGWGARLTGWIPPKTGIYYCKISANPAALTGNYPYQIRLWYGTAVALAASTHEPDDTIADAAKFPTLSLAAPKPIHGYIYRDYVDSLGVHYNWNDFDIYKVELQAGDTLTAELFTAGPDSCIRDLDTEMILLDGDGNPTPIENDDKDAWPGDPWENYLAGVSNTFSRFVTPPIPANGTYYLQVNSYYNSRNRTSNPAISHKDPGGGEYILKVGVTKPTGVDSKIEMAPLSYALLQNYPNPFNPTTTINYTIPRAETVKLAVYNMLGEKVADLVNKTQQAGNYNIVWNATDSNGQRLASGIYFFKLEAGSFSKVNKMIMLK